jgi:hypothetical protein
MLNYRDYNIILKKVRRVFAKILQHGNFCILQNYFPKENSMEYDHGS